MKGWTHSKEFLTIKSEREKEIERGREGERNRDRERAKAVFALKSQLKVTQGQTKLKALGFISYLFSLSTSLKPFW